MRCCRGVCVKRLRPCKDVTIHRRNDSREAKPYSCLFLAAVESAVPSGVFGVECAGTAHTTAFSFDSQIRVIRAIRGLSPIRFNDLTAAKQIVFIRVNSWLTFADGCG